MPTYSYLAKIAPHKTQEGELEAETQQEAINQLVKKGYFPISVKPKNIQPGQLTNFLFRRIPHKDIVLFTRQLSSLTETSVDIINGLSLAYNQSPNKYLKIILRDVIGKVKDGKPLSESLANYPAVFSNLYTSMIHSGEVSGALSQSLKRLSDFLEREEEFKSSVRATLVYPAFVSFVGALTVIILLTFVVPRLADMFEDMGQLLPLATRILIAVSGFLQKNGVIILALIIISVFLLRRAYRSPQGRISLDKFKLKIAIAGQIILKTEISRLGRTLSLLLSSGISVVPALEVSISVMENRVLKAEVARFREEIIAGSRLSHCLKTSKFFPELVTNIVTIGEETGSLESSLLRLADDYERETERSLKTLSRLLEPIIILIVGVVVGLIVLAMLLPIFQINLIIR